MNLSNHRFSPARLLSVPRRREWLIVLGLLLLALVPRLYALGRVPPGLSGDEVFNALDAVRVGGGYWPVFFDGNNGREPLFLYLIAASIRLFGETVPAARLPAALLGTGSVLLAYLIGRDAFNRRTGLIAGALMAVSLWPLIQSHWALRAISLTFTTALAVYFYQRASQTGRRHDWLLAGLALGSTLYTYIPARIFGLVIAGWFIWFLLSGEDGWRHRWEQHGRPFLISLLVALAVMTPLLSYMYRYPDRVNQRVGAFKTALDQALEGDSTELVKSVTAVLKSFTVEGDSEWRYHLSGQPIFDQIWGAFFYIGLILCLWLAWRRGRRAAACMALLLWTGAMLGPVAILEANASLLRMAGAMVPIYLIAGLGFDEVVTWLQERRPGRAWRLFPLLVAVALLVTLRSSWHDYFTVWANHPEVRHIYQAELAEMGRFLDANPPPADSRVFIGYKYVTEYTTPRAYDFISEVPVTWFLYNNSFAWQTTAAVGGETWYLIPPSHQLPPEVVGRLTDAGNADEVLYDDGTLAFTRYQLDGPSFPWEPQHPLDIRFVDGPALIGFDLPATLYQGDTVPVTVHGQIPAGLPRLPNELIYLQVQLEDGNGNVWASDDALFGYPQAGWKDDDRFVQQIPLAIPTGIPPGNLYFRFNLHDTEGNLISVVTGSEERAGPFAAENRPLADFSPSPEMPIYDGRLVLREATFSSLLLPGMPLDIALEWIPVAPLPADYRIQMELRWPDQDQPFYTENFGLWPDSYPSSRWDVHEQVTTFHRLQVPLDIPTEASPTLHLQLLAPDKDQPLALTQGSDRLAEMTLVVRDHLFQQPPISNPLDDVEFGPSIRLLGYDLDTSRSRPNGEVSLTLYWQAIERPAMSYTVFNHITGPDGQIQGQFDSPPVGDAWLSETWLPGEIVIDRRTIPIRPAAPPGRYQLVVGLYDAGTGGRLPVTVGGEPQPNDQLVIGEIEVGE